MLILYTGIATYYVVQFKGNVFLETLQCLGVMFIATLLVAGMLICALTPH